MREKQGTPRRLRAARTRLPLTARARSGLLAGVRPLALVVLGMAAAVTAAGLVAARRVWPRLLPPPDDAACAADPPEPLPPVARAALVAAECVLVLRAALGRPLVRARRSRWYAGAGDRGVPVLLVGDQTLPSGLLALLARRLRRDGWRQVGVVRGDRRAALRERVGALAAALGEARQRSGGHEVDVVAHGLAGLVVRMAVRTGVHGIRRVITLGAPHQGTTASAWFRADGLADAIAPGSLLLVELATNDPVPARTDFVALASADDARLAPVANAYYPGVFNIQVRGVGHLALLRSARVYELVRENLAADGSARSAVGGG